MTGVSHNRLFTLQLAILVAAAGSLALPGCRCSSETSDEERLKKKIDSAVVHIYVGTRVAIADSGRDANALAVRETLSTWLGKLQGRNQPHGSDDNATNPGWGDFGAMAKQVPQLKQLGANVIRGEVSEKNPTLPGLLKIMQVDIPSMDDVDLETDHGIFYMVLSALAAYKVAPVPKRVLLYEAWRTDPEKFRYEGFRLPLHALKSWTYGSNNFCDLSHREAQTSEKISIDARQFQAALTVFGVQFDSSDTDKTIDKTALEQALRAMAFGSVSWCHIARGNDTEARPHLRRFIDHAKKIELGPDQSAFDAMEVYYLCGGEAASISAGKKKLAGLQKSKILSKESHEVLSAWCDAADKSDADGIRRLLFSGAMVQVMARGFGQWLTEEKLKALPIAESVEGMTTLLEKAAGFTDDVTDKVKGWNPFGEADTDD